MKKCYICNRQIDSGVVVDKECIQALKAEIERLKEELLKYQQEEKSESD